MRILERRQEAQRLEARGLWREAACAWRKIDETDQANLCDMVADALRETINVTGLETIDDFVNKYYPEDGQRHIDKLNLLNELLDCSAGDVVSDDARTLWSEQYEWVKMGQFKDDLEFMRDFAELDSVIYGEAIRGFIAMANQ